MFTVATAAKVAAVALVAAVCSQLADLLQPPPPFDLEAFLLQPLREGRVARAPLGHLCRAMAAGDDAACADHAVFEARLVRRLATLELPLVIADSAVVRQVSRERSHLMWPRGPAVRPL